MKRNIRTTATRPATLALALAMFSSGCHPYSGSNKLTEKTSIGYAAKRGATTPLVIERPSYGPKALAVIPPAATAYLIGLVFAEADKAATKKRQGDYEAKGRTLSGTGSFPGNGYLVMARTVSDPENKYPGIAGVNDLINAKPGTPGGELSKTITDNVRIGTSGLGSTLRDSLGKDQDDNEKIAMLVLCEVVPLKGRDWDGLYGVTFSGMYYPLLDGSRFAGESSDLFTRISKSRESMLVEVYGPNGSAFTTGIVKVPLAWSPPEKKGGTAPWVKQDDLLAAYKNTNNKDQLEDLKRLLVIDAKVRLDNREAFVYPGTLKRSHLRADYTVSETSEATGWITKLIGKAEDAATGAVSGD